MIAAKKSIDFTHPQLIVTKDPISNHIFTHQIIVWKPMIMKAKKLKSIPKSVNEDLEKYPQFE